MEVLESSKDVVLLSDRDGMTDEPLLVLEGVGDIVRWSSKDQRNVTGRGRI